MEDDVKKWKTTLFDLKIEDDPHFLTLEDNIHFLKMEDNLIFIDLNKMQF